MSKVKMLAVDFGASSGRVMLGELSEGKLTLTEIHRFSNDPVMLHGSFHWDTLRLFHEIKQGILKAVNSGHSDISSIAIDTWGVDYGLIDKKGELISNPYHYRDNRTEGIPEKLYEIIPKEELYNLTGIQIMSLNTIFQLFSEKSRGENVFDNVETMLLTPDLFNYFLTGEKKCEMSIASTTQLLNPYTKNWSDEIIDRLDIPKRIFPMIIPSGTIMGNITKEISKELGIAEIPVIAAAGHDTQSAIAAVPADTDDFVYISSGTWSLMGTEEDKANISKETYNLEFTNEIGAGNKFSFLKNIMGLWLVQESRRQWIREGDETGFAELEKMARAVQELKCFINPDDSLFSTPGNMPKRVQDFCKRTNQSIPKTKGEIIRCIVDSLAMKYRQTLEGIEKINGKKYEKINIVGGGIKDILLCEMTAEATGKAIIVGPIEATSIGNILIQGIALKAIKDIETARKIVRNSFTTNIYTPKNHEKWSAAYMQYLNICR